MGRPTDDEAHYLLTALLLVAEAAPSSTFNRFKAYKLVERCAEPFTASREQLEEAFGIVLSASPRWTSSRDTGSAEPNTHELAAKAFNELAKANISASSVRKTVSRFAGLMGRQVSDDDRWSEKLSLADAIFATGIASHDYKDRIKK